MLDEHLLPLPHAPRPSDGLFGERRVERGFEKEHVRRRGEVDADGARAHGQQKHGRRRILLERGDGGGALREGHGSGDGAVPETSLREAALQPGERRVELRKDERLIGRVRVAHLRQLGDERAKLRIRLDHHILRRILGRRGIDRFVVLVSVTLLLSFICGGVVVDAAAATATATASSASASTATAAATTSPATTSALIDTTIQDEREVDGRAAPELRTDASRRAGAASASAPRGTSSSATASAAATARGDGGDVGRRLLQTLRAEEVVASGAKGCVAELVADAARLVRSLRVGDGKDGFRVALERGRRGRVAVRAGAVQGRVGVGERAQGARHE